MFETNEDAVGLVKIAEDSSTNLGGTSSANTLRIQSAGNIFDAPTAKISVTYNSRLTSDDGRNSIRNLNPEHSPFKAMAT